MENWSWVMGWLLTITNYRFLPSALCLLPSTLYPLASALCPLPSALWLLPFAIEVEPINPAKDGKQGCRIAPI